MHDVEIIHRTIPSEMALNKIYKIGSQFLIIGGHRYDSTLALVLDENRQLTSITLPSNSTHTALYGAAIAHNESLIAVGYGGAIYTSKHWQQPWTFVQDPSWKEFQAVALVGNDSAVIVGGLGFARGTRLKCSIEGSRNSSTQFEQNFEYCDVVFVNNSIGFISGYGAILKTNDGGQTWSFTTAKNDYFKAMSWQNEHYGIAIGYEGSIIRTHNGGDTWETLRSGNEFWKRKWHLTNIAYNSEKIYLAVGEKGLIIISQNNGSTWYEIKSQTAMDLHGIVFANANTAFATGNNGTILEIKLP